MMQDQNHTGVKTYPASFDGKPPATTTGAWVHVKSKDEGVLYDPSYGNDEEAKAIPVRIHKITKDENKGLSHATVSFDASSTQAQATRSPTRTGGHSAADMAHKNAIEAARYASEIAEHIKKGGKVPPWVAHKLSVVRTHLGDVKHACDYYEKYGKAMPEPEHPEMGGYRNRENAHIRAEKTRTRTGRGVAKKQAHKTSASGSTVDTLRRQGARVAGCGGRKK